jgi:hypothetical protein
LTWMNHGWFLYVCRSLICTITPVGGESRQAIVKLILVEIPIADISPDDNVCGRWGKRVGKGGSL